MRELDKTKVYSLEDLTSEEYRVLFNWLLGNDSGWSIVHFESWKNGNIGFNLKHNGSSWSMQEVKPTHNAKELFYTLENVQVKCDKLAEEQINNLIHVFEINGFKKDISYNIDDVKGRCCYIMAVYNENTHWFSNKDRGNITITYEKFMELFGDVKESTNYLVKGTETTDEVSPISSREKELKKTLKYLLKKDIILTPKQYKKLWKK